jgi:3-oxoacyl-[acyl-carrier-protein] synthase-3
MSEDEFVSTLRAAVRRVVAAVTADAGVRLAAIARVACPNLPLRMFERDYLTTLGLTLDQTAWQLGRDLGHLGSPDVLVAYDMLIREDAVRPGELTLLLSVGGGYALTAAVVEATPHELSQTASVRNGSPRGHLV